MGQEEVKQFVSDHMQAYMETRFQQGRCMCNPKGSAWKDLLDSMSELLTHHLQQVVILLSRRLPRFSPSSSPPPAHRGLGRAEHAWLHVKTLLLQHIKSFMVHIQVFHLQRGSDAGYASAADVYYHSPASGCWQYSGLVRHTTQALPFSWPDHHAA